MLAGSVVLDGYGYGIADVEAQKADTFGQPTGETVTLKELTFQENDTGFAVTIRFTLEAYTEFAKNLNAAQVVFSPIDTGLPSLDLHVVDRLGTNWRRNGR